MPGSVATRLQHLVDFLVAVRRPDGSMPHIGDADGGWLLPLVPRDPDDFRGIWSVAAAFFGRPDYAWAAAGVTPEVLEAGLALAIENVQSFVNGNPKNVVSLR